MENNYDVVIVGAGTAGLMLARELGKQKRKTLVLERKTNLLEFSFNTLGSFINLDDFDLTENVVAQKIDTCTFHSLQVYHLFLPRFTPFRVDYPLTLESMDIRCCVHLPPECL